MPVAARKEQLWINYKENNDNQAREDLIISYAPLVKYVAGRMAISLPGYIQKDDLLSYGIFGLIDAIEKFDHTRGIKFETYAISRVRGAMWDGLRAMDWVPYSIRQKAKELEKAYAKLESELGRPVKDQEVCKHMGLTIESFHQLLMETSFTTLLSLEDLWSFNQDGGENVRIIDTIEDPTAPDPTLMAEFEEKKALLTEALQRLPEREKMVIALYYYEGLTLKEIGKVLGVSESRISQLHTKAILRLRGYLSRVRKKFM